MEESLSLEETNKLRISLGLKPLKADPPPTNTAATTDTSPLYDNSIEAQDRRAVDNWKTHQSALEADSARRTRAEGIKKARDAAKRFAVLEGKGLGEADENEGDTATWIRKMKKRQKKLAEKMAKEKEDELERLARETKDYTADDLKGVRVGHDLEELAIGEEGMVLTLKDSTIGEDEEEGDELISTTLADHERLKERLELVKKKPGYNPHEAADGGTPILAQYDEEIEGKKKKKFVLDGSVNTQDISDVHRKEIAERLKAKPITLDIPKPEIISDYVDPATIKIKKPKKKSTRKRSGDAEDSLAPPLAIKEEDSEMDGETMQVDSKPTLKAKRAHEDVSFIDDDDLQSSLAIQRKLALKKRKVFKPDDLARQLREESNAEDTQMKGGDDEEVGLVIDETTEFVAALRAPIIPERGKSRSVPANTPTATAIADSPEPKDSNDVKMEDGEAEQNGLGLVTPAPPEISSTGLDEEMTISRGVGATLAMLNQRGLLKRDEEAEHKINLLRDREKFRIEKKIRELEAEEKAKQQRLRDRQSGKFDRMSAREREEHARWENRQRDLQEAREMAQRFKEYKPDVNLSYKDEFGRDMTQKEAFKHLSHQFHGKGSGKAKTEKRLKKIEDEKKREAASSLNSTSATAVQSAAKKSKQAGVRLM